MRLNKKKLTHHLVARRKSGTFPREFFWVAFKYFWPYWCDNNTFKKKKSFQDMLSQPLSEIYSQSRWKEQKKRISFFFLSYYFIRFFTASMYLSFLYVFVYPPPAHSFPSFPLSLFLSFSLSIKFSLFLCLSLGLSTSVEFFPFMNI